MRHILLFSGLALALATAPLAAQSGSDDGLSSANRGAVILGSGNANRGAGCGSGTTTTFFAQNNGFAGNMVDLTIGASNMTLECIDVNSTSAGAQVDIEVYAVVGTCVGKDIGDLCANGWVLIATGTGVAAGSNVPTPVNLTHVGAPYVFNAGGLYGVYVNFANYSTSQAGYTNAAAPVTYNGTHCDLTTYFGKAAFLPPCTLGSTFTYREFNGTIYTEAGGPTLTASGSCPGATTLSFTNCTPSSSVAVLCGIAGAFTKPSNPCGGLVLGIANPTLGAMLGTDGAGAAALTFNAPAGACGKTVQGVDVASCTATNAIVL